MIGQLRTAVAGLLPLRILEIDHNDPAVVLSGENWSLSIVCPWRVSKADVLVCAFGDPGAETRMKSLIGAEIVAVRGQSAVHEEWDPAFEIAGGFTLEVFADTDEDPWVMRLPEHTFVGAAPAVG